MTEKKKLSRAEQSRLATKQVLDRRAEEKRTEEAKNWEIHQKAVEAERIADEKRKIEAVIIGDKLYAYLCARISEATSDGQGMHREKLSALIKEQLPDLVGESSEKLLVFTLDRVAAKLRADEYQVRFSHYERTRCDSDCGAGCDGGHVRTNWLDVVIRPRYVNGELAEDWSGCFNFIKVIWDEPTDKTK